MRMAEISNDVQESPESLHKTLLGIFDDARMTSSVQLLGTKKIILLISFLAFSFIGFAQQPDVVYKNNIRSVRFHMYGNQYGLPVYNLQVLIL